jgi:hypothetical protein
LTDRRPCLSVFGVQAKAERRAFRDAELLADAVDDVLVGRRQEDETLGDYERARNAAAAPMYEFKSRRSANCCALISSGRRQWRSRWRHLALRCDEESTTSQGATHEHRHTAASPPTRERQPYSLDAQAERTHAFIVSQPEWRAVRRYSDQVSGKTLDRPGLAQALAEARLGIFDTLVVFKVDGRVGDVGKMRPARAVGR